MLQRLRNPSQAELQRRLKQVEVLYTQPPARGRPREPEPRLTPDRRGVPAVRRTAVARALGVVAPGARSASAT